MVQNHGYEVSASHSVTVYSPDFTGTHCTYPHKEEEAEFTGWLVTYDNG